MLSGFVLGLVTSSFVSASTNVHAVPSYSNETTVVNGSLQPKLNYVTTFVDESGGTSIQNCAIQGLNLTTYAPPASPQWIGVSPDDVESVRYAALPVGYVGTWHPPPGPQWVITVSGQWSVETTDGLSVVQGPGEVMFNDDTYSFARSNDTRIGHFTRQVGNVPNVQIIIRLKEGTGPLRNSNCAF